MLTEDASVKVLDMELPSQSSIFKRPFFEDNTKNNRRNKNDNPGAVWLFGKRYDKGLPFA